MINQLLAELEMANRKLKEKDKEIEQLKELCDKYEEEHSTTFEYWKHLVKEDYKSRNEKAIEYIELGLANEEEAEELLDILKRR